MQKTEIVKAGDRGQGKTFTVTLTEEECETIGFALIHLRGKSDASIDADMRKRLKLAYAAFNAASEASL